MKSANLRIALAVVFLACIGATARFAWIWYKHVKYKKQLDLHSMEASRLYNEARERSSKNGLKRQLEILVEKQTKNDAKTDTKR